jgi:urease alpha subunit
VAVRDCRTISSESLVRNGIVGEVAVADDGSRVTWNGDPLAMDPVADTPISRLHFW